MLRAGLALVLAAHGIGHILFLIPVLGLADWGQATRSWLFSDATLTRILGGLIWLAVLVAFSAAVLGITSQQSWWRTAAVIAAVISSIGLILFWAAPVTGPVWAALTVNILIVVALQLLQFPSAEAMGA